MVKNKTIQKLEKIQKKNNSLVCVGLDACQGRAFTFNKAIIDATHDLVCAYKPNIAFYEAEGIKGLKVLKKTIQYLKKNYPDIVTILDAKRGDIGNTNLGYVKAAFDYFDFDALTVHPYLGQEALQPFLKRKDKGIIVLCRTSNSGGGEFQDLIVNHPKMGKVPLYKAVAYQVVNEWNKNNNCALVVGATYPKELAEVRKIAGEMTLLIPGIGKQGGNIEKTVKAGKNSQSRGMIINSSRSIIFASKGKDFAQAARKKTEELKKEINKYR